MLSNSKYFIFLIVLLCLFGCQQKSKESQNSDSSFTALKTKGVISCTNGMSAQDAENYLKAGANSFELTVENKVAAPKVIPAGRSSFRVENLVWVRQILMHWQSVAMAHRPMRSRFIE